MKRRLFTVLMAVGFAALSVSAQLRPSEFHAEWTQAAWSNPAFMHQRVANVGFPGLSGVDVFGFHTGPAFLDFGSTDGVIRPSEMLAAMDESESFLVGASAPIVSLRYRDNCKFAFRFRGQWVGMQHLRYDRNLFELAWKGNGHEDLLGQPVSLSGMGLDALSYLDWGLSAGMKLQDRLWVGLGVHRYQGIHAIETTSFDVQWTTDPSDLSWSMEGGASIRSAGLAADTVLGTATFLPELNGGLPARAGGGWGMDLGFLWEVDTRWKLEGAVNGLGSIRWREEVYRRDMLADDVVLEGLDLVGHWASGEQSPSLDSIGTWVDAWRADIADTLDAAQGVPVRYDDKLATRTPETWRLGAHSYLNANTDLHIMVYRQVRLGLAGNGVALGLSRKMLNGAMTTHVQAQVFRGLPSLGVGVSLNGGPFRVNFSSQNILGLLQPLAVQQWHGQVGLIFEWDDTDRREEKGVFAPFRCW